MCAGVDFGNGNEMRCPKPLTSKQDNEPKDALEYGAIFVSRRLEVEHQTRGARVESFLLLTNRFEFE